MLIFNLGVKGTVHVDHLLLPLQPGEALLAAGRPLSVDQLQNLFDGRSAPEKAEIREAIATLNEEYESRGIVIADVASGFRVQVKAAIYDVTYDDFQANTFTGTGFNLQNAGKLGTEGIELEMLWRPTDSTEIQAHYAHNEGEYDEFEGGTCWDTYLFHMGGSDPGSGGNPDAEVCDRSGFALPYNPEDRLFVALAQTVDLGANTSMFIRGEYTYASSQWTDGALGPLTKQDSVEMVNLRLGFAFSNINSELTLWGRNITDERWYHGSFDQPIGLGRMNSYPAEPATYGVTWVSNFD